MKPSPGVAEFAAQRVISALPTSGFRNAESPE